MRILIVNFEYPPLGGGGGVATQQIAEELSRRHEVFVLTSRYRTLAAEENISGVQIHRAAALGRNQLSAASLLSLLLFVPTALWRGWRLCREQRFDVINAQFVLPSGLVAAVLAKLYSIPLVVSFIGGDVYDPSKSTSPHRFAVLRWLVRLIAGQAQEMTAISEDTKRRAQTLHGVTGDITVVPVGFSPKQSAEVSRQALGLPEKSPVIISVGRLITRKGFGRLLEALQEVPEATLVIVGEGALREKLATQAKQWDVLDRVIFTGFVSEDRKWQLLRASDVYVSGAEHEGFGIVFLEAMAAGLPIVAVGNGGQEDFLREGKNALLVQSSEPNLLSGAIQRLLRDEALRESMAKQNRLDVEQFTATNVARKFENILLKASL